MKDAHRHAFWLRVKSLTGVLLLVWLVVTLAGPWWARDLNQFSVFGIPFGFWFSSQGALLVYLGIIVVYCWAMDRLDAAYLDGLAVDDADPPGAGLP